jgi:hypothetical protein
MQEKVKKGRQQRNLSHYSLLKYESPNANKRLIANYFLLNFWILREYLLI